MSLGAEGPGGGALVLHVIPTAVARGAQREARALVDCLEVPGRHHRLMSLFAGPDEVPVDVALDYPSGARLSAGFDPRLVPRLRAVFDRLAPTVLVAHGGDPLKYLLPAMLGHRRPVVYYATGTFGAPSRRAHVHLWRLLMGRADIVAAEGEEVLDECRDLLGVRRDRLVLAPNGRDPEEFRPAVRVPSDLPITESPVVAFVGALTDGKRPGVFIDVVTALRRRGLSFRAVMCGGGPLAESLAAPAARAQVEMLGTRSDVPEVMRGADLLVFPSLPTGEGMPGVLIEAGLSGLPVVATAVPGVRSIVRDATTGFVVGPDDLSAMVEASARLVMSSDLRRQMGEAARSHCMAEFTLTAVAARWAGFLQPLVERGIRQRAGGLRGDGWVVDGG